MNEQQHAPPQGVLTKAGDPAAVPAKRPMPRIDMADGGLKFTTFHELYQFAECVASTQLVPKGITTPEAVLVAIEHGMELGLPPLSALQNTAVVNGRPVIYGDMALALCQASGLFDFAAFEETLDGDGATLAAVCTVRRLPNGRKHSARFSVIDAKTAGLWGKAGPWTTNPKRMLQMRARGFALRDTFADVLRGVKLAEEFYGVEAIEATLADVSAAAEEKQPPAVEVQPSGTASALMKPQLAADQTDPHAEPVEVKPEAVEVKNNELEANAGTAEVKPARQRKRPQPTADNPDGVCPDDQLYTPPQDGKLFDAGQAYQ